jgi:hypothetical protein
MDVCPHFSVLCCPVYVEALRRADPPFKECNCPNMFIGSSKINFGPKQAKRPNRGKMMMMMKGWVNSVNEVTSYGSDDRNSIPGRDMFLLCQHIQTGPKTHQTSYPIRYQAPFPWIYKVVGV